MVVTQPTVLLLNTYYPEFLEDLYTKQPDWAALEFSEQRRRIHETAFGVGDAYPAGLCRLGCDAQEVIVNADHLQKRWATEHSVTPDGNIHDRRRQIVAAQIEHYRPDVLYVFEWSPLGDDFLNDIKSRVKLLVGQIASSLPSNRTFAAYDLIISSWPPIVDHFRENGQAAEWLRFAFDERVLHRLPEGPPTYNVTFVGGLAAVHLDRIRWLESLLGKIELDVFGYGAKRTSDQSPIRRHHRGALWGMSMFDVLRRSRITLNSHGCIDVRGRVSDGFANNMRLFEATGVGTCLITDERANLADLLEPGREVVTYTDVHDCVEKTRHLLAHPQQRDAIARAGQKRTLADHTYTLRMAELLELLRRYL